MPTSVPPFVLAKPKDSAQALTFMAATSKAVTMGIGEVKSTPNKSLYSVKEQENLPWH